MKEIGRGAEAIIYLDGDRIVKKRIPKGYRLGSLDERLRKARTKRESKILDKLDGLSFPSPKLFEMNLGDMSISMERIQGHKLSEELEILDYKLVSLSIGKLLAKLHDSDIIHGDLTTSNIIFKDRVNLIDFGLSNVSTKIEDKAVDLHLLRQALESKHHTIWQDCFDKVIEGYGASKNSSDVVNRLHTVESRGRNKSKRLPK